ncbi:MAG TPA: 50S ribosomal protein L29 [Candidatus Saccharimonadales bacterium]
MADKKTATKKASTKSEKTLQEQLVDKRKDLLDARKSHAAGELVNPRVITGYKKDIARLMTNINAEKEAK